MSIVLKRIKNKKVITVNEFGLSKSRNLAIKNSTEKYIILSDDDVKYIDNYEKIILDTYKKYPKADCICFWVESENKNRIVQRIKSGKIGILKIEATTNQACCACIPCNGIYNKYLFYFLLAYRKDFIKMGAGGAQPNISKEKIVNAVFPLPPLAEQKRIVAKLEEILPLCDKLK